MSTRSYNFSCLSVPPNIASPSLSLTHTNTQCASVFSSLSSPMVSSQKLTEYECRSLENIRRNEEMMDALRIHSKATQLFSTSSKAKGLSLSLNFTFHENTLFVIIHPKNQNLSLFSFRKENPFLKFFFFLRVEAKSNNLSPEEEKPETQTRRSLRSQGMRPEFSDPNLNIMSLAPLGPISMSDAYSGAGFGKELIERISSISKKPHEEFGDGNSIKGVCETI